MAAGEAPSRASVDRELSADGSPARVGDYQDQAEARRGDRPLAARMWLPAAHLDLVGATTVIELLSQPPLQLSSAALDAVRAAVDAGRTPGLESAARKPEAPRVPGTATGNVTAAVNLAAMVLIGNPGLGLGGRAAAEVALRSDALTGTRAVKPRRQVDPGTTAGRSGP